jgi:predicted NodU family carbamoyl transferase
MKEKLMGLQAYGKPNKKIEEILLKDDLFVYKDKYNKDINFTVNVEKIPRTLLSQKN